MPETFDPSSPTLAVTTVLDQSQDSHIDQLQRAAIGPVNADYYRPILSRFETYDRGSPSWNWAACLCTLNWMVFRGMWMPALAYLGGLMLAIATLFVVTRLAAPMAPSVEWGLWAAWATLVFLVPGLFGNTWLFGHYRLRLARALSATPTVVDACQMLGWQASSRRRLIHLAVANGAVALAIAAVWLWPGPPGQKSARVDQGEVRGAGKSAAIENAVTASPPARGAVNNTLAGDAGAYTPASTTSAPMPSATATSAPASSVSAPIAMSKVATSRAQAPDIADIRHAAIAARSRKAHYEQTAPVAAVTAPTGQDAAPPPATAPSRTVTTTPVGRYLINVGLFAQEDNARRAFERLRAAGLPATTENLQRGDNTLTRVRVGPFVTRAQADAVVLKIRALQLDAVVIQP